MKKKFLLVGLVAVLGVGSFVVSSCSGDDDGACVVCAKTVTAEDLKGQGLTCAEAKEFEKQFGCQN